MSKWYFKIIIIKKRQTERKKHCLPFLVNKYCVLILQNILKNGLHRAGSVHFKRLYIK